ncbi:TlpA disulfide reductase family protein [Abyssalbus ytuae]|uniref:AhpC/TSA family protein n=1 Tax=Abyssalbus ytuae TaxID=2926907 RepID=A0A9E6ZKK4_9FLAO|nr:TlpA disulfide reductase family protein [Abyssalbus ytuae]UOB17432.1 AhpC/TSA family protein [Abyssalbus ytuae]
MKKSLIVGIMAIIFMSCEKKAEPNTYNVTGTIEGVENGQKIFLQKINYNSRPAIIDTIEIIDGKFSFSGKSEQPSLHFLFLEGQRNSMALILEEGNIDIEMYKDSLPMSKISGSPSNNDLYSYIQNSSHLREKLKAIRTQQQEAKNNGDMVTLNTLNETYTETIEEGKEYDASFVKNNPDSYMAVLILDQIFNSNSQSADEVKNLFNGLSDNVKNTEAGQILSKKINDVSKLSVGAVAPDFTGPTPDGKTLSLKEALGEKLTIVDFWAAWCKPCRAENPNLVALYNKFHDQGLNVLGVSLDRKAEDWTKAIEDDKLEWNHVSNLQFWQDPIAQLYNIRTIPATYLLDAEGKIIAKDLRGQALHDKVEELLSM